MKQPINIRKFKKYPKYGLVPVVTTKIYPAGKLVCIWTRKYPLPWDGVQGATGPVVPETDYEYLSTRGALRAFRDHPAVRRAIFRWYPLRSLAALAWFAYDRAYWRLIRWAYRWPRYGESRLVAKVVAKILA